MRPLITTLTSLLLAIATSSQQGPTVAFTNGRWFDGRLFPQRTVYSVDGALTFVPPTRIDSVVDLAGPWVVPPFAEAHNHNIDGADEARSLAAIRRYVADGVFYVKIQGNYRLTDDQRGRLPINRPGAPDVAFAQAFVTASGGHPIHLHEQILWPRGYYHALPREALRDRVYVTVDSAADVEAVWSRIEGLRPDFLKVNLWCSDEFALRKDDPTFAGRKGLDPALLPLIVRKAHASGLRVSAHVVNGTDVRHAIAAGVDELVHVPAMGALSDVERRMSQLVTGKLDDDGLRAISTALGRIDPADPGTLPLAAATARLAAERRVVMVTTMNLSMRAPSTLRPSIRALQAATLRMLRAQGVPLAIGSDNVDDSSALEAAHLQSLGVLDNLALLTLWTDDTARAIFPDRKIGQLQEGYEASFLALENNPVDDWSNVARIKARFKQGVEVRP